VGIIANPASGKDIRRLVAYGSVFDNQEKVRIVRRIILGLEAVGVGRICYMPDYFGIVERALSQIQIDVPVDPLVFPLRNSQEDSIQAARVLEEQGADCIITLGGDGTNRVVAKGNTKAPMLPISTGTNNVFPYMVEATIAGLAAGLVARKLVPLEESTIASTKLEVVLDGEAVDMALVDVVTYDDLFVGSRAVWDVGKVRQIFLNRAKPDSIGFSSIGGVIQPIKAEEHRGLFLEIGTEGLCVTAPVAPGVIRDICLKTRFILGVGDEVEISPKPSVLALDGEREVEIRRGRQACIRLSLHGPLIVDIPRTMAGAMKRKVFIKRDSEEEMLPFFSNQLI
jgi:predicted polyphosphate/ATP-dependent NAD kinase